MEHYDDPNLDEEEIGMSLVPASARPFLLMDILDDEAILAELRGEVIQEYVYEITDRQTGRKTIGLSKKGVDAACAELAKQGQIIRESSLQWSQDEEYAYFTIQASRYAISPDGKEVLLDSVLGVKRQWKSQQLKDGSVVPNPFWFEHGAMKAARNARRRLIPEDLIAKVIGAYKDKGRKKVEVPENEPAEGQPARKAPKPQARHWIENKEIAKKFWGWTRETLGLTDDDTHKALGVESVKDFQGSMAEAKKTIEEWLASQIDEEAEQG